MAMATTEHISTAVARPPSLALARILGTLRLWRQRTIERSMLAHMTQRDIGHGHDRSRRPLRDGQAFWRA